ncbi:YcxB family protein [Streptomyces sp. NBC_00162]|uniref:YcxB family protein n=1 Tax=Streptomyces sp. NBC_00162 TaxID=2903629 RepID=UPI00214C55D6|nr:YcxB family protein [Streptomyces sp. NBC_00162]UUU42099.1 YcxB family protein [Streptomyces sp. NBC_00162]
MDMNAGTNEETARQDGQAVELVYRTTKADLAHALRVRDARTAQGRRRRGVLIFAGTLLLGLGLLALVDGEIAPGRPAGFLVGGAVLWAFVLFGPRLQARAFGGLLDKAGEARTVVDGAGVQVSTAASQTRIGWEAQPRYAETAEAFVMLSDDKGAVAMTVLPKRGVREPADVDRLRALLDANLRRI